MHDLQTSQMRIKFLTDSNLFSASSCPTCVASASSTNKPVENWGPELALDGKIMDGDPGYFHSEGEELAPWLQIEFPNEKKISSVEIANR
jgi:hypothetical protein